MKKPGPDATVAELINAKALEFEREGKGRVQDVWDEHPDSQCFVVSSQEALVLDIDPSRWPRMHAAIRAFEACSDFCDDGSYPEGCWDEVYKDYPDVPMNMENIEAFAEFCTAYAGLSAGEAYRAWLTTRRFLAFDALRVIQGFSISAGGSADQVVYSD